MNKCTRVRALHSCFGEVLVARVVVSLVVDAIIGLIAHFVIVVFVEALFNKISCKGDILFTPTRR